MESSASQGIQYVWVSSTLIKVYVLREIYYASQKPLAEALKSFEAASAQIPVEYRQTVKFEVSSYDEPGGSHPEVSIYYFRPSSEAEIEKKAEMDAFLLKGRKIAKKINDLAALPTDKAIPALTECLGSENVGERQRAVDHLSKFQGPEVIRALRTALDDPNHVIRTRAVFGLSKLAGRANEGGVWAAKPGEIKADENHHLKHWKEWAESSAGNVL